MIRWLVQRCRWPITSAAALASTLALQACSGKVQRSSACRSDSSCGGALGSSDSAADAGTAAVVAGGASARGPVETCVDGLRDAEESDVDCGGPGNCVRCSTGDRCTESSDCESDFCRSHRCAEPSCSDDIEDQDETAVDCGGSSCEACADEMPCLVASDCQSAVCSEARCVSATCTDGVKNQDESDVDCGGACEPCPVAAGCYVSADCDSWICSEDGQCTTDIEVAPSNVVDDFEDGDLLLPTDPPLGGRVGNWYAYDDGTGLSSLEVVSIAHGARSTKVLRAGGQSFISWGSGFGVDLNNAGGGSSKLPYDAAAYAGITFRARAQTPLKVTVVFPDADTEPAGGLCTTCDHHYGKAVQVTTSWQRFTVAFTELVPDPGGVPSPTAFDPSSLFSIRFQIAPGDDYDLTVDDVAFIKN